MPLVATYHVAYSLGENYSTNKYKAGITGAILLYDTKFMLKNDKEIAESINSVLVFIEKSLLSILVSNNLLTDKK